MTENKINDPWESGENPQLLSPEVWGQCIIDMYYCVLEKGVGKIQFDPQVHSLDKRRTAVEIIVTPLPEMNADRETTRSLVAESREWAGIVLPSIKVLGVAARELNGKYVRVKFQPTGKTYTKTNPDGSEETRNSTTLTFVKVFADEAACRADYAASGSAQGAPADTQYPEGNPSNSAPAAAAVPMDKEKQTAFAFLRALVNNAVNTGGGDVEKIRAEVAKKIATMPPVAKFFTVDSPEVAELIAEKIPF